MARVLSTSGSVGLNAANNFDLPTNKLPIGPAIEDIKTYQGTLCHSAQWDTSLDWKDKKVAVLGTGSSSIQMVPHLAKGYLYAQYSRPLYLHF